MFELKMKSFPDHLVELFRELGEKGNFADVTLVSDDHIQTRAHKVVLSACSPVLKSLLVNNFHTNPMLYMRGIQQTELQGILKFMYYGETQILENRFNDFISVARDLDIKELSLGRSANEEEVLEESISSGILRIQQPHSLHLKQIGLNVDQKRIAINANDKRYENNHNGVIIKHEIKFEEVKLNQDTTNDNKLEARHLNVKDEKNAEGIRVGKDYSLVDENTGIVRKRRKQNRKMIHRNSKGEFLCDECDAVFGRSDHWYTHKRSKHEGERFSCNSCDAVYTQAYTLTMHERAIHKGEVGINQLITDLLTSEVIRDDFIYHPPTFGEIFHEGGGRG